MMVLGYYARHGEVEISRVFVPFFHRVYGLGDAAFGIAFLYLGVSKAVERLLAIKRKTSDGRLV
jgi:hypothetical protein